MKKRKIHTKKAMRKIGYVANHVKNHISRFKKVNWIIVHTSHKINKRKGAYGHRKRQKIRHRLWNIAKQKYPALRKYSIPREISGKNKCVINSDKKIKIKPSHPKISIKPQKGIYNKNIPALISAIIIGIFVILVPIIDRKTIYENILQNLTNFTLGSLGSILIIISMVLVLVILSLFLLNGLGYRPNQYSKWAGYLSIFYFSLIFMENVFLIKNTNQVYVLGISLISYWIASFGIPVVGIIYLIIFEGIHRNKKNQRKIVLYTITCLIALFLIGFIIPTIVSSIGLLKEENFGGQSNSAISKYHVGEVATDNNGKQGFAIISDNGQGHYTVIPVFLDYSRKGWHTNGKVDPQIVTYQSVEKLYPVEWAGGRMDITHIPDRDLTDLSSIGSSSNIEITIPPTTRIPTTIQRTIVASVPISEILNRHNYYRRTVTGVNIPDLVWSSTLASSAQSWANYLGTNNLFQHSSGHSENLAAGYTSWTSAIDGWGSEKSNFIYAPFGNVASKTGNWQDIGHYTQIIWKTTTQCGCGCSPHPSYGTVYVCHYAPAGNIWGYYPY